MLFHYTVRQAKREREKHQDEGLLVASLQGDTELLKGKSNMSGSPLTCQWGWLSGRHFYYIHFVQGISFWCHLFCKRCHEKSDYFLLARTWRVQAGTESHNYPILQAKCTCAAPPPFLLLLLRNCYTILDLCLKSEIMDGFWS